LFIITFPSTDTEDDAKKRFFFNLFNNNNNNNNNGAFSNLLSNFPSILNPFAYGFTSSLPVIVNPNRPDLLNSGTCTGTGGEPGLCLPSGTCNLLGRTASGSCGLGGSLTSCCISKKQYFLLNEKEMNSNGNDFLKTL